MRQILFTAIAAIILQACSAGAADKKSNDLNNPAIPVKLIAINSDTSTNSVTASGLLSTEDEARLSFKIGGVIESVLVKEGDRVSKGQLLATLKSTEIAAQVQQVQLSLEKARRDYQRMSNLYKDSVATLEQLQNTKTSVDIARQNLQQVSFNQQYAKIYAPANGFIVKQLAHTGEVASAGSAVLFMNIASGTSKWILKTGLADYDWAAVQVGNKASVSIDAFPAKTFTATVSKKALAADAASGSFVAELQVDFGKEQPAVGMFGTAAIQVKGQRIGFAIPFEALLEANGKKGTVFVTGDRKTVKKVEVEIASIDNNRVYLSGGLQGYAYVVSSGSPYLADGATISVQQ